MIKKLHLKSLLLIAALLVGSSSAWADNATITFANQTSGTSDSGTTYTTENFVSNGIASSSSAFGTISCSATSKCYSGKTGYGLKAGASSSAGSFTISFSTPLTNVTKITINRASYNSSNTANITVKNSSTTLANAVSTPSNSTEFADMEIGNVSISSLGELTVQTTKYCYIRSITITYGSGGGNQTVTSSPALTFDFSDTSWGFPDDYLKDEAGEYTNDGYTFVVGATSDGHKALTTGSGANKTQVGLIFGKNGATLTFPAFSFNVSKIVINGPESGASTKTTQNIFVGETAVSTQTTGVNGSNTYNINTNYQAAGTVYVLKVTNANNSQVYSIEIYGYETIPVTSAGLATYASNFNLDYTNVSGIEAYIAKEESGAITLTKVNKVPAGTGVLLRATAGGTSFNVPVTSATTDDVTGNLFVRGTGAAVSYGSGPYNYVLSIVDGKIGFYKANNNTVATNRAYLQTNIAAGARLEIDGMTGITGVNLNENQNENRYYDLQGRHVAQPTKGLYIVNGRKVVIK